MTTLQQFLFSFVMVMPFATLLGFGIKYVINKVKG